MDGRGPARTLALWAALLTVALLGACDPNERAAPVGLDLLDATSPPVATFDPCSVPTSAGCPCDADAENVACGTVHEERGQYVICSVGYQGCVDGVWTECIPERLVETAASEMTQRGLRLQALNDAVDCENLCDPYCMLVVDTPDGVPVSDELVARPDGITLPGASGAGSCSDLLVAPAASSIVISAIASNGSVTATPASRTLTATCTGGAPVEPSWSIDAYDRSVIDGDGKLTVFAGVASPIVVTASSAVDTAAAVVDVLVQIQDRGANASQATIATAFDAAGSSTDTAKTLYPYKNTVFPLDLKAPLVQWQTGGTAATDVQVALRAPVGCVPPTPSGPATTCRFWYSKIFYGSEPTCTPSATGPCLTNSVPAWQVPQEIWNTFDRSAAGRADGAEIIIQRRYASTVRPELKIPVKFASDSLHGTAYYTQYRRDFNSAGAATACAGQTGCNYSSASYAPGKVCAVGNNVKPLATANISTTRAIDLSLPSALNKDPFKGIGGCPVCHSVSANGSTYVSSSQTWQTSSGGTSKGINSIGFSAGDPVFTAIATGAAPTYTGLADNGVSPGGGDPYNNNERTGENSRGFAYSAITPDGTLALQGSSFWGNTADFPTAGINAQDGTVRGLTDKTKPFFFAKTAQPGIGVQLATTAALPTYTWAAGSMTGSGALTIDGFTLNTIGQAVLVKNEATTLRNGVYSLTVINPWRLARRYDADAAGEMTPNMEVRVSDGNANLGRTFYISAPAVGATITPNTTNITFTERVYPPVTNTAAPLAARLATTAALAPATVTMAGNVLTAGANGALTIDGQSVALNDVVLVKDEATASRNGVYTLTTLGTASVKWKLTRSPAADAVVAGELQPGLEVKVSQGTTNAGRVYVLSSPIYGATFTLNSTSIGFEQTALPSMMVPVISPDGKKVAYVSADDDPVAGVANSGWRRGLSMFSFDQATRQVSSKKRLLNNYSSSSNGTPVKWPFFESDSRSLLYVETDPAEYCSAADGGNNIVVNSDIKRACFQAVYGSMSPTTRGYWPGKIYSIDSAAANPAGTRVELAKLNDAEDSFDDDLAYQPTALPFSAGGYRWVIFTSPRAFGNQLNAKNATGTVGTHFTCAASMLWVSALSDTAANGTDRSNPAFLLPGQYMGLATSVNHYINERGYLVPTACKNIAASCTTDDDCCGAATTPKTAACRAPSGWAPASGPPAKTCAAISGTCSNAGGSCNSPADCCNNAACVGYKCAAPPTYTGAIFERDYAADCGADYQPVWELLSYHLTTDKDSRLEFDVQTASTAAGLDAALLIDLGMSQNTVVKPADPEFKDVGAALDARRMNGWDFVRISVTFIPSSDSLSAPILHDWEMRYSCEPAQ